MKTILCMIALNLLMLASIQAQVVDKVSENIKVTQPEIDLKAIPKGAWKLVIHTNKIKEENYQMMGETILEEGYMIDKVIRDFHIIRTFPQGYKKMGWDYILNLVARDSTIVLTGFVIVQDSDDAVSTDEYNRIENIGIKGSAYKESFREMVRLAGIMAGDGLIEYISE